MLNLAEPGLTDDRLAHALTHAPPASLILLEDVDSAFLRDRDPRDRSANVSIRDTLANPKLSVLCVCFRGTVPWSHFDFTHASPDFTHAIGPG